MAQAERALRQNRIEDAQALLINLTVREPRNGEAWLLLASVLTDPERQLECLERARQIDPHNEATRRAIRQVQQKLADAAFGTLRTEVSASPLANHVVEHGDALPSLDGTPSAQARQFAQPESGASAPSLSGRGENSKIALPSGDTAAASDVVTPLLEYAESLAQAVLMTVDPADTRQFGQELIHVLERAVSHDAVRTRRWARSAARSALVKYEKSLTALVSSLPGSDPRLPVFRGQRQNALDLLK